jgi:acetyl esterase
MAPLEPALHSYIERVLAGPARWELSLDEVRSGADLDAVALWGEEADAVADVHDVSIPTGAGPLRARVYRPDSEGDLPCLVWLHGGGWVLGSIESHDHLCHAIAARTPCCVLSIDYRLAPEHPFPAAVDDAWAGLEWTLASTGELRIDSDRIAVGGDSAGGNLAAVLALRARDAGVPLALQLLVYPVTDADLDSPSYREHASGLNLNRDEMKWFWDAYVPDGDQFHPEASPLRAETLAGVAPALIQIAEHDPLFSEGEAYGRRLAEAGVPSTVTYYDGTIHGFVKMPSLTSKANDAVAEMAAALATASAKE